MQTTKISDQMTLGNRPIVLLGSGLETRHPDRAAALFIHFAMLKTVQLAHLLPPFLGLLSSLPAGIFLMLLEHKSPSSTTQQTLFGWRTAAV